TTGKKISFNTFINDSIINKKSSTFDETSQFSDKSNQVAEAYIKMPEFENFIKNNSIRAENITVLSPKSTEKVSTNELILINWVLQNTDSLNFIVFDNKAKIVFEEKIARSYKYLQKLKPGLYYWQLETSEEALFTGKFIVQP
ncbi:MAG: hypothetical protein P1P88_24720, partial [Bacteroidales bacterium]|nr:hypothetical protein [Bacteroidales bacterium]